MDYVAIKKLKVASIKNETKKNLCSLLKTVSDEFIDFIEKMLCKDPLQRIEIFKIMEHPWMLHN